MLLGAIIAGGLSSRFGSDKAMALIDGRPLIEHVISTLQPQVDRLIICGRSWRDFASVVDLRADRIGPLAGLESAMRFAVTEGYDATLAVPVDCFPLPDNLRLLLEGCGAAVLSRQHLIGYWPTPLVANLSAYLEAGSYSVHGWIADANARFIDEPPGILNINCLNDLPTTTK